MVGKWHSQRQEQMNNRKKFDHRWFLWFGLRLVVVGALIALLTSTRSFVRQRITISVDTNGAAMLGGAHLPPKICNAAFSALAALGVKAKVSLPAAFADRASASKAADTLASMYRAGLLTTNQPHNPQEPQMTEDNRQTN